MDLKTIEKHFYQDLTIDKDEAMYLLTSAPLELLGELSHNVTSKFASLNFDLCSICNVKSGRCSEDCKWCAQSLFHQSNIDVYDVIANDECLKQAKNQELYKVKRFALVASGKKPTLGQFARYKDIFKTLKQKQGMKLCASLGLVDESMLKQLKEIGVSRIHCNIETAPSFFKELCSTHTFEDKLKVIKTAQNLGLEVCSGVILGMGESLEQRVEMAFTLRELKINSIPLNILHPIKGTALGMREILSQEEILRAIAMFRLTLPKAYLRFAGGRAQYTATLTQQALYFGVNSSIVGNLLTTQGRDILNDLHLFKEAGFEL